MERLHARRLGVLRPEVREVGDDDEQDGDDVSDRAERRRRPRSPSRPPARPIATSTSDRRDRHHDQDGESTMSAVEDVGEKSAAVRGELDAGRRPDLLGRCLPGDDRRGPRLRRGAGAALGGGAAAWWLARRWRLGSRIGRCRHDGPSLAPAPQAGAAIVSRPRYGRRTSGTMMLPSGCWYVSRRAATVAGERQARSR